LEVIEQIHILPYHRTAVDKYQRMGNPYTLIEVKPPASESMQEIACQLEGFGFKVVIGG
jgi:pyruvate formate lyase activating enzyme